MQGLESPGRTLVDSVKLGDHGRGPSEVARGDGVFMSCGVAVGFLAAAAAIGGLLFALPVPEMSANFWTTDEPRLMSTDIGVRTCYFLRSAPGG